MPSSIQQLFSLEGKTALVTGGTRGIGQAMALAFAEAGADVLLVQVSTTEIPKPDIPSTDVRPERRIKPIHKATNRSPRPQVTNLHRRPLIPESIKALVPKVLADGHQIDILLNCGGIQKRHPPHQFPDDDWNAVLQVNLTTVFTLCRDVGAHMLTREKDQYGKRGSIINIASLLTFQGGINVPAYAASKGALGS